MNGPKTSQAFYKRILRSDEALFWLNILLMSKIFDNVQDIVEVPLPPQKGTVWCAVWAKEVIGSYIFKNKAVLIESQWRTQ